VGGEYGSISFRSNYGNYYSSLALGKMETNLSIADIGFKAKFTTFYTDENYIGKYLKGEVKTGMLRNGYSYDLISKEQRYGVNLGPASVKGELNFTNFLQESWMNFTNFV